MIQTEMEKKNCCCITVDVNVKYHLNCTESFHISKTYLVHKSFGDLLYFSGVSNYIFDLFDGHDKLSLHEKELH